MERWRRGDAENLSLLPISLSLSLSLFHFTAELQPAQRSIRLQLEGELSKYAELKQILTQGILFMQTNFVTRWKRVILGDKININIIQEIKLYSRNAESEDNDEHSR